MSNFFEPTGNARQAAAALWDLYSAYKNVGFTAPQAMQLVTTMLVEQIRATNGGNGTPPAS